MPRVAPHVRVDQVVDHLQRLEARLRRVAAAEDRVHRAAADELRDALRVADALVHLLGGDEAPATVEVAVERPEVEPRLAVLPLLNSIVDALREDTLPLLTRHLRHSGPADPSNDRFLVAANSMQCADEYCVAALDFFLHVLGAEAANLALRFQAHGGVFLAGGVMAKLAPCLRARGGAALARLRQSYLGKGHSVAAYKQCPLYVVGIEGDALAMEGVWAFASGAKCGFRRWAQSGAVE